MLSLRIEKVMTPGFGILLQGVLWLLFWLGPALDAFRADPRWGHNFALAMIFIVVGLAYQSRKISCQLLAVIASFITVPIELAYLSWSAEIPLAAVFLFVTIIMYAAERNRVAEFLSPPPKLKAWLKIHLINFAYLGLAHMPLIFFLVRWFHPQPFVSNLPVEYEWSTSIFNMLLLIFAPLAAMDRYVKNIGKVQVSKIGFAWAILMIIAPLLSIAILGN